MKILCADIGGTSIKSAIVQDGRVIQYKENPTNALEGGPKVIKTLIEILKTYDDYDAIGISTAGQVDTKAGKIRFANKNIPNYTGMEVVRLVEEALSKPCRIKNDVNSAALGETNFGAGKEAQDLLCLTYGTGVGGAIIIDRQVYSGHDGVGGEFGHIFIHPGDKLCGCGNMGCYEMYASAKALVNLANSKDKTINNGRDFFAKVLAKDEAMLKVLESWAKEVAYGLVSLTHVFNPSLIVLGGGILEQEIALLKIKEEFNKLVMPSFSGVELKKAELGNQAGLLGAYSLYLD